MSGGFTVFRTPLGACGIAWSERGLTRVQLPEATAALTRERLLSGRPGLRRALPPLWVREAVELIQAHLGGQPGDLRAVRLDLEGIPPFHRRVYEAARTIEPGRTRSYGEVAALAGSPAASRAAGQALARNPFPLVVPCHRVLGSDRKAVGFSAHGGCDTKRKLLALEGVRLGENGPARNRAPENRRAGNGPAAPRLLSLFEGSRGLGFDSAHAVEALRRSDPRLGRLIERVGSFGLKPKGVRSPFEALAEAIVYQQLNARAASAIFARLKALHPGRRLLRPEEVLAAREGDLLAIGLSRAKRAALRDLARKTLDGTVPSLARLRRMDDAEIIRRLDSVRGVGRWTVEMLLIFRLGRPDVLPCQDYALRKSFARAFRTRGLPTPMELERHGERWRPFRTVASWYLWEALDRDPRSGNGAAPPGDGPRP